MSCRAAFRIEVKRKQLVSDGTASLDGQRFEIPLVPVSATRRDPNLRIARWT